MTNVDIKDFNEEKICVHKNETHSFRNNNIKDRCYWCGKQATSKEHIPPKCLFPEHKDINDFFRKDLITVPSCDKHNNKKSGDDEILMACLASTVGANDLAYSHTKTKLRRAYLRNNHLFKSNFKELNDKINIDKNSPVSIVEIDNLKIIKSFESIARGLYFYEHKERCTGRCSIVPTFLKYLYDPQIAHYINLTKLVVGNEYFKWEKKGANPKVFEYQFGPIDQYKLRPMVMTFYETLKVYVAYIPEGINSPFKLV